MVQDTCHINVVYLLGSTSRTLLSLWDQETYLDGEAIRKNKELTIVAESDETGPYIILNSTGSQVFVTGHPEYDVMSLHYEYVRDVKRGLNPDIPKNYYKDDDPTKKPVKSWRCHANAMYYNWLNYYVYQVTPYDLDGSGLEYQI